MRKEKLNNLIMFSGGGTLGSVTPLLGLYEDLVIKYPNYEYLWVGTKNGPEKNLVLNSQCSVHSTQESEYNKEIEKKISNFKVQNPEARFQNENEIKFIAILSGKFRRYFDLRNFIDFFKIIFAVFQSFYFLIKYKPRIILTAGGFVCVPLVFVAKILKIPAFVHQQDFEVGLANKLMKLFAEKITVCLNKSLDDYGNDEKVIKIGNFLRKSLFLFDKLEAIKFFSISGDKPVLLVSGGGTGSMFINDLIRNNIVEILKYYEVIHLTGACKNNEFKNIKGYHVYEFLSKEMKMALNLADVVVSRVGFGTMTELCALKKASILIPLPGHQDLNSKVFKDSSFIFYQNVLKIDEFLDKLRELSENIELRKQMGEKMSKVIEIGNERMMNVLEEYL